MKDGYGSVRAGSLLQWSGSTGLLNQEWMGSNMAKLIKVDGTEIEVKSKGKKWTLTELQEHVGGFIEIMPGIGKIRMILDEEGLLKMKPINVRATDIVLDALKGK